MGRPTLILVSGPAGSGKTTLAHQLAAAIGCPALGRDEIKEGMVLSKPGFVASHSDPLTTRTYGLFFEAMSLLLRAEVTLVAEAAFQHGLWVQGLPPLDVMPREVVQSIDWWLASDCGVGSVVIVVVEPSRAGRCDVRSRWGRTGRRPSRRRVCGGTVRSCRWSGVGRAGSVCG